MTEAWVIIPYCDSGNYSVSSCGRLKSRGRRLVNCKGVVRNWPERLLATTDSGNGYPSIVLERKGYFVHRLVAELFIPRIVGKDYVNHKDGDKHNNRADNLEWMTFQENITHAVNTGLYDGIRGSSSHWAKLKESDVLVIKSLFSTASDPAIARRFKVHSATIRLIRVGVNWKHVH